MRIVEASAGVSDAVPSIERAAFGRDDEAALVTDLLVTHAVLAGARRRAPCPYPIVPEEAWMVGPWSAELLGSVTRVKARAESMAKPDDWRE